MAISDLALYRNCTPARALIDIPLSLSLTLIPSRPRERLCLKQLLERAARVGRHEIVAAANVLLVDEDVGHRALSSLLVEVVLDGRSLSYE